MEKDKLIEALLAKAKNIEEKATPGPWMWEIRSSIHDCKLMTAHSGQYYVMQFERWGMQDACPEFQMYKRYSGAVTERGSMGMVRADKLAKSYPGKEHHKGFDDYIDHPDAEFIAESRALLPALIGAVEALTAQLAAKDKQLGLAVGDISHVCRTCGQFQDGDCPILGYKDYPKDCERWEWRGAQETGEDGG